MITTTIFTYKIKFVSLFFLFTLFLSCGQKKTQRLFIKSNPNLFYNLDSIYEFEKDSLNEVFESQIITVVKKDYLVEKLYYLNPLNSENSNFISFTIYGYSEFSHFVYLIILDSKNNKLISSDIIFENSGDGGDFYSINSKQNNPYTYLKTKEVGYYNFSCPYDTTFYSLIQVDSCKILENGKIQIKSSIIDSNIVKTSINNDCQ